MVFRAKKQLQRLNDKQFIEDIKKYIKASHSFYEAKIPELKILAKRLHEEYKLKDFYKVFNKFWNSGYHEERSLAIYTLEQYKEEFDKGTWRFIKNRLKEIQSWDKLDYISINIIGEIILKNPGLRKEILKFSDSKNIWLKRMAIISSIPFIEKDIDSVIRILTKHINDKETRIQEANGIVLREIGKIKPNIARRFILKNIHMPAVSFNIATEEFKELRRLRKIKPLKSNKLEKLFFWKNGLD